MKFALSVLVVIASLVLNAQTLQGKAVRVYDGDTIATLEEASAKKIGLCQGPISSIVPMPTRGRIRMSFLDTNVQLYAVDGRDTEKPQFAKFAGSVCSFSIRIN